jgi:hypothetical protein
MRSDTYTAETEPEVFAVVFSAFRADIAYAEAIALSARKDEETL